MHESLTERRLLELLAELDSEASKLESTVDLIGDVRDFGSEATKLKSTVNLIGGVRELELAYRAIGVRAQQRPRPRPKPEPSLA
jgi:hypothetical protein